MMIIGMAPIKKRPIHQYPEASLAAALAAVRSGTSIREAARRFGVPKTKTIDRLHGRVKEGIRKMGPPTILSNDEEIQLVNWLKELAKTGFPQKKCDLLNTVHKIVITENEKRHSKKEDLAKNGMPAF
ncbi:hypothetical protein NQ314_003538 [Rhamnusium bicolor]|uniref:HTH psq-type domain-containing protein n=1 Tax=Rhamnusium bicolor TaxID=1586634 RepID=A0AAV8ZP25_9CUCU|nr:hypothetical protein NQ314_003538 [Rhamnusium bicolor]